MADHGEVLGNAAYHVLRGVEMLSNDALDQGRAQLEVAYSLLRGSANDLGAGSVALALGLLAVDARQPEEALPFLAAAARRLQAHAASSRPTDDGPAAAFGHLLDLCLEAGFLPAWAGPWSWADTRVAEYLARSAYGGVLSDLGRFREAEDELRSALSLARSREGLLQVPVLRQMGTLRARQGKLAVARHHFEHAYSLLGGPACGSGDPGRVESCARVLLELGEVLGREGEAEDALARLERARGLARRHGLRAVEIPSLVGSIAMLRAAGREAEAGKALEAFLELADGEEDPDTRAMAGLFEGLVARGAASPEERVGILLPSDTAGMRSPAAEISAVQHLALGQIFLSLGAEDLAEIHLERAAELARSVPTPRHPQVDRLATWAQALLASIRLKQGEMKPVAAFESFAKVDALDGISKDEAVALGEMRKLYRAVEDAQGAGGEEWWNRMIAALDECFQRAMDRASGTGKAEMARMRSMVLGMLEDLRDGQHSPRLLEQWLPEFEKVLGEARTQGDWLEAAKAAHALSYSHFQLGNIDRAVAVAEEAAGWLEGNLGRLRVDSLVRSYHDTIVAHYELLLKLLTAAESPQEAFAWSERSRARGLLVLLGNRPLPESDGVPEELRDEAAALRAEIRGLLDELDAGGDSGSAEIRDRLLPLGARYEELLIRMQLAHPGYAEMASTAPAAAEEIQAALEDDAALVSYYILDEAILVWILDRRRLVGLTVPARRQAVEELVRQMRRGVASRQAPPPAEQRGARPLEVAPPSEAAEQQLYSLLVAPLLGHLRHRRLILIPHGALHYLPFAALRSPATGRYLIEDYTLSYAPSASSVPLLGSRRQDSRGRALVLGDPRPADSHLDPLPGALNEAMEVAGLLGVEPLLGDDASEERLQRHASGADLIHVAAHGLVSAEAPLFSYLALAPGAGRDGRLEATEIATQLDLTGVRLVVLSACDTALGERSRGDEVLGFVRAFLQAGAATVLASLWSIDDEASATLMKGFYRRLVAGAPPARALREAQLELLRSGARAAPYYWAAFTLHGRPGAG